MARYVIGGRELEAREWNELRDWERDCLATMAHMLPIPAVVTVDLKDGLEVPEGFAVLGLCIEDGLVSLRLERGDTVLAVLNSAPVGYGPQVLPDPVLAPVKLKVAVREGEKASLILVDLRKLLSLRVGWLR